MNSSTHLEPAATPPHAAPGTPTIMERLRDSTAQAHHDAEHHPLQRGLATGQLPVDQYIRFHAQLFLVHSALESHLAANAALTPAIARVVKLYQLTAQYHAADMRFFGVDPAGIRPLPATDALIREIAATAQRNPAALLGYQYVLEGSKNGSKFLSRVVMKAYNLAPRQGVLAMAPYADHQRAYWQQFKDDMNSLEFTEPHAQDMIDAASSMFRAIGAIGDDVLRAG